MEHLTWGRSYLMVAPHHYRVEYIINPYMDPSVPVESLRAWAQWHDLRTAIEVAGGKVSVLDSMPVDCPDMVYAMNLGYAMESPTGEKDVLVSRMRYPERQGESEVARAWFAEAGFRIHEVAVGPEYHLESGDMFPWQGRILAGVGPRTSERTLRFLTEASATEVLSFESVTEHAYHLDLSFCPLTQASALIWPGAFSAKDLTRLLALVPAPILLEDKEALEDFSANSIVVNSTAIMPARTSRRVQRAVEAIGLQVVLVDVSEFEKGGGSIRCMTNPLDLPRKPEL